MKGFIYVIRSHQTEDVYYGSTKQSLSQRMGEHRRDIKKFDRYVSSFEIVKYDDAYIELVEEVEYKNRTELLAREGFHIRNNKCVNKIIAGRTKKEWDEEHKEERIQKQKDYNLNHIEERKKYLLKNKDKIQETAKQYKIQHKEDIDEYQKQYMKQYTDLHKEELKNYKREYYLKKKALTQ